MENKTTNNLIERPPVVAIMGHVDHGKSSLLDYIRKSNIVSGEAGGITQHIAAYEVAHTDASGTLKKITFIDTPGHAAFSAMRNRGARVADIAILIVSAEEGVKTQTIEAIKTILVAKVPYIVALTKIDRPNANPERVKSELLEHGVYVEGYGGDIPVNAISSVTGAGIDELLETILLLAQFQEFTGDPDKLAEGFVVESHLDEKRGVSATMIIKNGTVTRGQFIVAGTSMTGTRIIEDFAGKSIESATFSSPITITGFSVTPAVGSEFQALETKKDAEEFIELAKQNMENLVYVANPMITSETKIIPVIIKSDVFGSAEAIDDEIVKLSTDEVYFKVIKKGVGIINESDLQLALSDKNTIIIGFNVDIDKKVLDMNEVDQITVKTFNIIYKLTEWLEVEREVRRPRKEVDTILGRAKILKVFSSQKNSHVAGGRVLEGSMDKKAGFKLMRGDEQVARGTITELQMGKAPVSSVGIDEEFGMQLDCKEDPLPGDVIETFKTETK
ncbi:MAG: infB [Patescibacteria group bacterium]|nr:infB [Patescibacteria group bacterium]